MGLGCAVTEATGEVFPAGGPGSQLRGQEDWGQRVTQEVDSKKVIHGLGHKLFRWGDGDKATLE